MSTKSPIAILGAMDVETWSIEEVMIKKHKESYAGYNFTFGELHNVPIILTSNAGIGKVLAAVVVTILIEQFKPQAVIFSGVAARVRDTVQYGDVVIAKSIGYHDYGKLNEKGFQVWKTWNHAKKKENPLLMPASDKLLNLAKKASCQVSLKPIETKFESYIPSVVDGIILTGDVLVNSSAKRNELAKRYQADALEMEGAVIAEVCLQRDIPWLVVRGISDSADKNLQENWSAHVKTSAGNAAILVTEIVRLWSLEDSKLK